MAYTEKVWWYFGDLQFITGKPLYRIGIFCNCSILSGFPKSKKIRTKIFLNDTGSWLRAIFQCLSAALSPSLFFDKDELFCCHAVFSTIPSPDCSHDWCRTQPWFLSAQNNSLSIYCSLQSWIHMHSPENDKNSTWINHTGIFNMRHWVCCQEVDELDTSENRSYCS